ncbi:MAG: nitroreductase family protein [Saprospiraceae bacterium]|nr:nitroreductase family protein [Saprospiraceae bacterium]
MKSNLIKKARTQYPVIDLIKSRWSARSFDSRLITEEEINTIFEASSWAASANNEQPWIYYYSFKYDKSFSNLVQCLNESNQHWAINSSVLLVAAIRKTFEKNGKINISAEHDLGMANANLLLQAASMNIFGHIIGGFNKTKVTEILTLEDNVSPVCMIALGFLADADLLEEPYKTRELNPRERKKLNQFSFKLSV